MDVPDEVREALVEKGAQAMYAAFQEGRGAREGFAAAIDTVLAHLERDDGGGEPVYRFKGV